MTTCKDACLGSNINHNKLFLFDVDSVKRVALSSANLVDNQMELPNNLVQVNGDPKLYRYLLGYWNRMKKGSWSHGDGLGDWQSNSDRTYAADLAKVYLYPRGTGDNVRGFLDNVAACRGDSKIWVTPFTFREARSAVAERLAELQSQGCDVRVLVDTDAQKKKDMLGWLSGTGLQRSTVRHTHTHNKFMVIDAKYGSEWRSVVFTGSHNLNGPSLRANDEVVMRILEPDVVDAYAAYFGNLYDRADTR